MARRSGGYSVRLTCDHQIAVDADVRKLLDSVRLELGDALRGVSTPKLEPTWSLEPIVGSSISAATAIVLENRTAKSYIDRNIDKADAIVASVTDAWAAASIAPGDGVDTSPRVNVGGGPLPRNIKR